MEAARALAGSAACGALGSARRASGSAASGSGAGACASARARVRRWVAPTAEARPADAPRGSAASTARPTRWRERGAGAIGNRGSRVAARAAGDSGGGDGERAPRASPPARPRRRRRVGASGASSPGSSSPETAEAAPADTRAAAAAARLRSERMKSPAATAALSSVRARTAADRSRRSLDELDAEREDVSVASRPARVSSRSRRVASREASREERAKRPNFDRGDPERARLRDEASTISRALRAARAAPGGLSGAFGADPDFLDRLLDALCRADALREAADVLREAIETEPLKRETNDARDENENDAVGVGVPFVTPHAVETVVRRAARAGRVRESGALAAFLAFRAKNRARASSSAATAAKRGGEGGDDVSPGVTFPSLRSYTDVISALGKAEARRRRTRGGAAGGEFAFANASSPSPTAVDVWRLLEEDVAFLRARGDAVAASELRPDGAAYTAAAAAHLAAGDEPAADALVRAMRREGVEAGARLYNVLIAHHGFEKNLEGVRSAERAMATSRVRPNAATHGARVAAYCRCGEIGLAERALESGRADPNARSRPTVRAYTALAQAHASAGDVAAVDRVIALARADGVEPNCHTYTVAIDGLVERGDVLEAERFARDMRDAGIEPSAVTYNCLLKSCFLAKGADSAEAPFERAERLLAEMRARGVDATVATYNTLIDACVSANEPTEEMFKVLSALVDAGHRPDVVTYTTLLKHFGKVGDVVAARWLMREMDADANVRVDASARNALVDALAKGGLTREATRAARAMRDDGHAPDASTYGALLDGFARAGDARSAASLYAALKGTGEGGDGRGWSPSWTDAAKEETGDPYESVSASARAPDARMRAAVVAACAASVGAAAPEKSALPPAAVAGVVEAVIADAAASAGAGAAAEATALRERWRRESASAGIEAGRTVRRVRANKKARGARGGGAARTGSTRDDRAGCPVPASFLEGPANATSARGTQPARAEPSDADGVSGGGFEMWKHWLGLPSRYYAPGEDSTFFAANGTERANENAFEATRMTVAESRGEVVKQRDAEQKYTRAEIAEAVRVLRAAASKKFPDDPETALRAALDAAGEGDAGRVVGNDENA